MRLVEEARKPEFYIDFSVPDTLDGRFEMILIHMYLVLHRLKDDNSASTVEFSRLLLESMMQDMDRSIRELGAGDTGVGKRVKAMAGALYGRFNAYDEAIAGKESLHETLKRNAYGTVTVEDAVIEKLCAYILKNREALKQADIASITNGTVKFSL